MVVELTENIMVGSQGLKKGKNGQLVFSRKRVTVLQDESSWQVLHKSIPELNPIELYTEK